MNKAVLGEDCLQLGESTIFFIWDRLGWSTLITRGLWNGSKKIGIGQ